MSRARPLDGDERVEPAHRRKQLETDVGIGTSGAHPVELGARDQAQLGHERDGSAWAG